MVENKRRKKMLITLASIIGLIVVWYVYQITTAKPADQNSMDGRKSGYEWQMKIEKQRRNET